MMILILTWICAVCAAILAAWHAVVHLRVKRVHLQTVELIEKVKADLDEARGLYGIHKRTSQERDALRRVLYNLGYDVTYEWTNERTLALDLCHVVRDEDAADRKITRQTTRH